MSFAFASEALFQFESIKLWKRIFCVFTVIKIKPIVLALLKSNHISKPLVDFNEWRLERGLFSHRCSSRLDSMEWKRGPLGTSGGAKEFGKFCNSISWNKEKLPVRCIVLLIKRIKYEFKAPGWKEKPVAVSFGIITPFPFCFFTGFEIFLDSARCLSELKSCVYLLEIFFLA